MGARDLVMRRSDPGVIAVLKVPVLLSGLGSGGVLPVTLPETVTVEVAAAITWPVKLRLAVASTAKGPGMVQTRLAPLTAQPGGP